TPRIDSTFEYLRHVVRVDVVQRLHAEVRQRDFFAARDALNRFLIAVACRREDVPPRPHDMPRLHNRRGEAAQPRFGQEIVLNRGFLNTVFPERMARLIFAGGDFYAMSVNPDRAAVEKMLDAAAKMLDQMAR